jgi:hypothetical protein
MKVVFHDMPVTRIDPSHGVKCFEVVEPFRFQLDRDLIEVPVAFYTDWASVGLAASIISPIHPTICRGALGHDFLYMLGYGSRSLCDEFIAEAMRVDGAAWWRRAIVLAGLTLGGWRTWRRYRRENNGYTPQWAINSCKEDEPRLKMTVANWKRSDGFV